MVVDASVWISAWRGTEAHSAVSRRWLQQQEMRRRAIWVPYLALAEVAGAVSRVTRIPQSGIDAVTLGPLRFPGIQIVPTDAALGQRTIELAAQLRIRGADATYVALAESVGVPLVTLDQELLTRAASAITVMRPA